MNTTTHTQTHAYEWKKKREVSTLFFWMAFFSCHFRLVVFCEYTHTYIKKKIRARFTCFRNSTKKKKQINIKTCYSIWTTAMMELRKKENKYKALCCIGAHHLFVNGRFFRFFFSQPVALMVVQFACHHVHETGKDTYNSDCPNSMLLELQ